MKITLLPKDQQELNQWIDQLKEVNADYELISKSGKVALKLEEDDASSVLGITQEENTLKSKITQGLFVAALLVGALAIAFGWFSNDESLSSQPEELKTVIDYRAVIGRPLDSLIQRFGEVQSKEALKGDPPCEAGNCEKMKFSDGLEIVIKQGRAVGFTYFDTTGATFVRNVLNLVGLETATPTYRTDNSITWRETNGLNVIAFSDDKLTLSSLIVTQLSDEEVERIRKERKEAVDAILKKSKIEEQFSKWDGSHANLKYLIKENMNDPKSFEHIETKYVDKGDHLIVQMKFRGKNAFGATILNTAVAKVDLDGKVLGVEMVK